MTAQPELAAAKKSKPLIFDVISATAERPPFSPPI